MKAVVALAFLAIAQASQFGYDAVYAPQGFAASPMMTRAMFLRYGFVKPALDSSFITFARSMGADFPTMSHLRSLYEEPAVMFFIDPVDNIVSYYAAGGIEKAMQSPEMRAIFPSVMGAADSMAIVYNPESFLGSYKSVLPGHFFVPSHHAGLVKIMRSGMEAFPMPFENAIFKKAEIADIYPETAPVYAKFNIEEFPYAYKSPVALSLFDADYPVGFPSSDFYAKSAFPAFSPVMPHYHVYGKAAFPHQTASPAFYKSYFPFIRSETPDFHYAYIPDLKFPMFKHFSAYEPIYYAKPAYKLVPYTAPIATIAPAPINEPAFPVASQEAKAYPFHSSLEFSPKFYHSFAPIAPAPINEPAFPVASPEAKAFFPFHRSSLEFSPKFYPSFAPSVYPSYYAPNYLASRYYAPIGSFAPFAAAPAPATVPIVAAPASVAGASAASMASASSVAGSEAANIL